MSGKDVLDTVSDSAATLIKSMGTVGVFDDELASILTNLVAKGLTNNIHKTFETFTDQGGKAQDLWMFMKGTAEGFRRAFVGGLLGGFPLPNVPYHAVNVVSQPFIAAVTVPGMAVSNLVNTAKSFPAGMVESLRAASPTAGNLIDSLSAGRAFDNGGVRTPDGLIYTSDEIDAMYVDLGIANRDLTTMEFHTQVYDQVLRSAKADKNFQQISKGRYIARWTLPQKQNIWNNLAINTDQSFRKAVFRKALANGYSIEEAAEFGRRALLDYGDMTSFEKESLSRWILFYSFQRQMTVETVKALGRPAAAGNLRRLMVIQDRQQRADQIKGYYPKYLENYLLSYLGKSYEGTVTRSGVMRVPALEVFNTTLNMFARENSLSNAVWTQATEGTAYRSQLKEFVDAVKGSPEAEQGKLPSKYLMAMKASGMWPFYQEWFGLVPVERSRRRPGEVSDIIDDVQVQYKFKNAEGKKNFVRANIAGMMLGFHRNLMSYGPLMAQLGVGDELELKRFNDVNPFVYLTGIAKNFRTLSPVAEEAEWMRERIKMLKEIEPSAGDLK